MLEIFRLMARVEAARRGVRALVPVPGTGFALQVRAEVARINGFWEAAGRYPQSGFLLRLLAARLRALEALLLARLRNDPGGPGREVLVSVILPTRDREALLPGAIRSVLGQSYENWELIIVDDGSRDATGQVVGGFLGDARIRYQRQAAKGGAAARNAGLALAQGELIAYLDSDNVWDPGYLAGMVGAFADGEVDSAYGILVLEDAPFGKPCLRWEDFDRARLLQDNFIDLNVFMHRRAVFEQCGGFDEALKRLVDWDLILRYTEKSPARAVPVGGAYYRARGADRVSVREDFGPAYARVRGKWRLPAGASRKLRVLYALWHYPQASETYIEAEIQAMLRRGVEVEVWSEVAATTPYAAGVAVHRGALEAAIGIVRPDVIHVHWLNIAYDLRAVLAAWNIPVTVRAHGFDFDPGIIAALCAEPFIRRVYLWPHQLRSYGAGHDALREIRPAFETSLFLPARGKDPKLVFRAAAALPAKDLRLFLELAKILPEHRFVLAVVACNLREAYAGELLALRREIESPAQVLINVPQAEVAAWMARAAIYVHTVTPPGEAGHTPVGMPVSIAEAMASGCHILVRDLPPLVEYVAEAGTAYAGLEQAAGIIRATQGWDEAAWARAATVSADRAWRHFSGGDDFQALHEDWAGASAGRASAA